MYRQGDILITATDQIPTNATPVDLDNGRVILAHGEATGHAHVAVAEVGDEVSLYELVDSSDIEEMRERFLKVESGAKVVHDEHTAIVLPPGNYRVIRQREYAPERPRYVAD